MYYVRTLKIIIQQSFGIGCLFIIQMLSQLLKDRFSSQSHQKNFFAYKAIRRL